MDVYRPHYDVLQPGKAPNTLLDRHILEAFDRALAEYAPAVRERLVHPGLPESEISAQFATIGVRPSDEAIAWWEYFDYNRSQATPPFPCDVLPDFQFLTVEASLGDYRGYREIAEENAEPDRDPEVAWGSRWLPLFFKGSGGLVVLDCDGPPDSPSPVRSVRADTIFSPEHAPVFSPSLGELLAGATRWMQLGTCRFEPERRLWWPLEAWIDQSDAERYALPDAGGQG